MRLLVIILLFLSINHISVSQSFFRLSDSLMMPKQNIKTTYLDFHTNKIKEEPKPKHIFFDFSFSQLDANQIQSDSTYDVESLFNYGFGFDYNYDLDNYEMIDFTLMIAPSISSLSLNFIRFSIIFYF